jgi:hypothetical protein
MNLPDVTLILQMIHFLIAYAVMYKFVFTPALVLLLQKQKSKKDLERSIESLHVQKTELIKKRTLGWAAMKERMTNLVPKLSKTCPIVISLKDLSQEPGLSDIERNKIVTMIKSELMDIS